MTTVDPDQMFQDHYKGRSHDDVKRQLEREYEQFKTLTPELRRVLTRHKVKCSKCSVALLMVVDLSEPALVYVVHKTPDRPEQPDAGNALDEVLAAGEWARGHRGYTSQRGVTPWWPYSSGPDPLDPARDWRTFPLHPACNCQKWPLTWAWLADRIERSGKRTTVVSPQGGPRVDT